MHFSRFAFFCNVFEYVLFEGREVVFSGYPNNNPPIFSSQDIAQLKEH